MGRLGRFIKIRVCVRAHISKYTWEYKSESARMCIGGRGRGSTEACGLSAHSQGESKMPPLDENCCSQESIRVCVMAKRASGCPKA